MEDAHRRDQSLDRDLVDLMARINRLLERGVSPSTRIELARTYTELAKERNVLARRWD